MRSSLQTVSILILALAFSADTRAETPSTAEEPLALPAKSWSLSQKQIRELPNGNHIGSLLEFLFQPAVMANPDTGGFSRPENIQISMLGESYKWQRWYLGGANISNPGKRGEPLLYLPVGILDNLTAEKYAVENTAKNGIHMNLTKVAEAVPAAELSLPLGIGGPAFIPRAVADREPASDWGAPTDSRGFAAGSLEGHALLALGEKTNKTGYIFTDAYFMRRNFNNLSTPENAGAATVLAAFNPHWNANDALHFAFQARARSNLGAEYYFSQAQTLKSGQYSVLADYQFASSNAEGAIAYGYAYRQSDLNSDSLSRSLVDSLIQAPAFIPERAHTMFLDTSGFKKHDLDFARIEYGVNARAEFEYKKQQAPENRLLESLYGASLAATEYDSTGGETNYLLRWQPFIRAKKKFTRGEMEAGTNAHIDWGFTNAGTKLGFVHPAAHLKARSFLGNSAFSLGGAVLHDTLGFSLQEVSFLNADSLSGTRYNWSDSNGNGVPDANELTQGSRTGGKYHSAAANLQAPQKEELSLDFAYAGWKNWLMRVNINGRVYRKLFEVRYADGSSPLFTASSAANNVTVYNKTAMGNESYQLANSDQNAYYGHLELTLAKTPDSGDWIFSGSVGGYFSAGYSPQGLGMFYNDIGAYNESTADPNFRENRFARLDNDRGYIGKIMFGRRFMRVFKITNVLRYRDGEPMAGYQVVTGLTQGPIAVPTEERGGGLIGIGRHTYSLAWDLRLRYDSTLWGNSAWAFLDIYNLLNSRTELAEYPLVGAAFRDPVEQGTQRTMRIGVGMNF